MKEFSHGFHASVLPVSEQEKILFPNADLVRIDHSSSPITFLQRCYIHNITHNLFPSNFIQVVGATRGSKVNNSPYQDLFKNITDKTFGLEYRIYSKMADLPQDHAVFSSHMELNENSDEENLPKVSVCSCKNCKAHRQFHNSYSLNQRALNFVRFTREYGIEPELDPSDYCLTPKGIVFFEIAYIFPDKIRESILRIKHPTQSQKAALKLVDRYEQIKNRVPSVQFGNLVVVR